MDQSSFLYIPRWVKYVALTLLLFVLLVGLYLAQVGFATSNKDFLASGVSIAQFSAYGTVAALVILFLERETSVKRLSRRLDEFFSSDLRTALASVHIPVQGAVNGAPISLTYTHKQGQPRAFYCLSYKAYHLLVQVDANVRGILVMYHYPSSPDANLDEMVQKMGATVEQAKNAGWVVTQALAKERFDDLWYFELFFRMKMEKPFLLSPPDVFYWLTDISLMTRSAMLHGIESGLLPPLEKAPQTRWCEQNSASVSNAA